MDQTMRRPRVIIFDDEPIILDVFRMFFEARDYEVMTFKEPLVCPIYGSGRECHRLSPCGDIIISDYRMPRMNGADLLREQQLLGCRVTQLNKALISGDAPAADVQSIVELGMSFFQKPVDFRELGLWVDGCERRMDLTVPLAVKRREARLTCGFEVRYGVTGNDLARKATALNMSASGLCIRTDSPLEQQQNVVLMTSATRTPQPASVRWVRESGPKTYLVGLRFSS